MSRAAPDQWTLRCDGGARGNPGPGAAAWVLTSPAGVEVEAGSEFLGSVTNNVAESRALIAGLGAARTQRARECASGRALRARVKRCGKSAPAVPATGLAR